MVAPDPEVLRPVPPNRANVLAIGTADPLSAVNERGTELSAATVTVPPRDTGDPETEIPEPEATLIELFTRAALGTWPKEGSAAVLPNNTVLEAPAEVELNVEAPVPNATP